jgi:hypothetical protein
MKGLRIILGVSEGEHLGSRAAAVSEAAADWDAIALFSPAAAHGYPFAKIVGLLLLTYFTWLAA